MSDTPTADPQGDESDDPLAELESIVVRSAQRFEPESTADDAELAYYLETKPRSGGHSASPRPAAPAPQNRNDPYNEDFLGSSEDEFEAAFRSLEKQTSSSPVREGSAFKNEPVSEEPPPQDYSRTFAQTFEEETAGSPGTSGQEFETGDDAFEFDTRSVTVTAVTGLVFVAVIGALIYSCVGVKNTGEPIVIKTDTSAVKNLAATETGQPSSNKLIDDRLGSTDDSNNEKIVSREEQPVATAATSSGQSSVAERVRNPSDVASPPSLLTPSMPPMQSEPTETEPSAPREPAPPLPKTVDTEADRVLSHAGTGARPHAPPPVRTPRAGTYTIQHGDTLIAIAAHFYGDVSQWPVIAQANPTADPMRLQVGQKIKLPRTRPSPSR
ncbi:MAG: LysM peptidoglycan-binding domain-containing protein [Pseudomonadota bacterium]|nr:LysM peptidoglycan-binding domain-containing protein [Gammaproteobacteria bacterium]MDQ3581498.1 LysM peptidoglycan-binding domain-containing protein [Pseudomonadota bacterium]